jgi:prolyl oligopeptidase
MCTFLGRDPEKDPAIFGFGAVPSIEVAPDDIAVVKLLPGSRYALGIILNGVAPDMRAYVAPVAGIGKSTSEWRKIADFSDSVTGFAVHDNDVYLLTYKGAPRYKVVRTDARKPDLAAAETVVPAGEAVVTGIDTAQDALYVQLLDGGIGRLLRVPYETNAQIEHVALPFSGSLWISADPRLPGLLVYLASWTRALKIYAYDPASKEIFDTRIRPAGAYDNPQSLDSTEVKIPSHDGTLIPLSIVHLKSMKLDGSNPLVLEGYGAYGFSQDPYFDPKFLAWTEQGGVDAVCHVRGGGEYGEEWHLAGKGATKPNTWLDFIGCAEYLVKQKYSSPQRLAAWGGSAGGILIGRAITERPDLFGAAIPMVGMLDTLRSETTATGVPNIPEFGSTKTEEGFKALYAMSAFHHVKDRTAYPAVLLTTGANDPRVEPWESAKMAARLQAATSSGKPVLLRVDYGGGHDEGSGEDESRKTLADAWSFLLWQFGVPEFQPRQ